MAADPQEVQSIFHDAVEHHAAAQWPTFLDGACGSNVELRRAVEALLRGHEQANSLLDEPAPSPPTADNLNAAFRGTMIGPYKLLEPIGEGGMGTVWMAQQTEPVKRVVALKLIKAGMDSKQVIARFEAERQALALMDHPNIARVLDAGTTDAGRPYFVMDLVKGVPITKYCDEHHLTPRQRLQLFIPVCQAVQHAHQKGIIHRDLKPSNVLVALYDGKPVPKVIDFGVAKAAGQPLTEQTLVTGFGAIVGTLEYMSPEQAEVNQLDIDTRSDVYSLGVLLYELLTGSPPFSRKELEKAGMLEMLRVIREQEPSKPSTKLSTAEALPTLAANRGTEPAKLTKLVRGELDWIVMKALEKDRSRRYETANGFAMDLQRYLADEPVLACPPSARYRFGKFARRNKVTIAIAGLVLLVLLTVTGGISWNVRDRAARRAAIEQEVNQALKETERLQEQTQWPEALSAVKRAEGILAGGGSDELRERVGQLRKDLEMVLRIEDIRLLASEWKDDKFDHEAADRAYAKAFADYGIDVAGLSADEAARRIRARVRVAAALTAALDDWAFSRNMRWALSRSMQDRAGALALIALAESVDPDPWRMKIRQAARQNDTKALAALADSPELLHQPPSALLAVARTMLVASDEDGAIGLLRQAQRQYPGDFWINFELAITLDKLGTSHRDEVVTFNRAALASRPQSVAAYTNLGLALEAQGKLDEAIGCYRKALELDPNAVRTLANLGLALNSQGKVEEAIAACRKAIEIDPKFTLGYSRLGSILSHHNQLDDAIACYRKVIELEPKSAWAHRVFGNALAKQGKLDEAIACYRKAIEIGPKKYAEPHNGLGIIQFDQNQLDEAAAAFRKAVEFGPKIALYHNNLGNALLGQQKWNDALACYRKAIELEPKYVDAHCGVGNALRGEGKVNEAIICFRTAIALDPKSPLAQNSLGAILCDVLRDHENAAACFRKAIELDPKSTTGHFNLGNALRAQGKLDEAIVCFRKAIELDPKNARAHTLLGAALAKQNKLDEAIVWFGKAIEVDPKSDYAYYNLGNTLYHQKKLDEATAAYRKAIEINPEFAACYHNLGTALRDQNKLEGAIAAYRKAIDLDPQDDQAHYCLGLVWMDQNKLDNAEAHLRTVINLDPKRADAHNMLGRALSLQNKLDEAIASYHRSLALDPDANCYYGLGVALRRRGKLDDAVAAYHHCIKLDPKFVIAYHALGYALSLQGKLDEAIAAYRTGIELNPNYTSAYHGLGNALLRKGKLDDAIAAFKKFVELDPKNVEACNSLGNALMKRGFDDEAAAVYRQAIKLKPDFAAPHYNLFLVLKKQGKLEHAIPALERVIELEPKHAFRHHELAWLLATWPEAKVRDPKRAVQLAGKAVELAPREGLYWNTLGAAHYRTENWKDAVVALEKSMELRKGGHSSDWFFLAMAHWQMGNKEEARKRYDEAVQWMEKHQPMNEELRRFRAEAAELLGVK